MSDDTTNGKSTDVLSEVNKKTMSLAQLIQLGEWDLVQSRCDSHPEQIKGYVDPLTGRTVLHDLCSNSPVPQDVFRQVVELYPEATKVQEKSYGATPLHILCWRCQRSVQKVEILLHHTSPEDLFLKNRFGGTALHSACGNHAGLPVIKVIVQKNPSIVMERTYEYDHTALTAVWHSHLQSIPGHMQIARILQGEDVQSGHFDRFWEKVEFLARESFKQCSACPKDIDPTTTNYVLHGLMNLRAPLTALKVAIKRNPEWASYADADGNYPLHHVVIRRPFRLKDTELITELIHAYPAAAGKRNNEGNAPIFIAVHDRMVWEEGLGKLVKADTDILAATDKETGLYPFLLAASLSGRVAVNSTYQLLSAKPHLVKEAFGTEQ
jgi:ankyrin repeat protein